ncbi:MAG: hypothetical protein P4L44_09775 [Oryzomonas sp.]|uniref:hypothetical protein n=1 Tax=Oryzomonas sp. TaxID=2855186 RepID=UPI00284E6BA9|nr:hypothetical protein [Oryzomonas sp.]MDR3580237.1 hypothetical protein [Oryzomonas sp.]
MLIEVPLPSGYPPIADPTHIFFLPPHSVAPYGSLTFVPVAVVTADETMYFRPAADLSVTIDIPDLAASGFLAPNFARSGFAASDFAGPNFTRSDCARSDFARSNLARSGIAMSGFARFCLLNSFCRFRLFSHCFFSFRFVGICRISNRHETAEHK